MGQFGQFREQQGSRDDSSRRGSSRGGFGGSRGGSSRGGFGGSRGGSSNGGFSRGPRRDSGRGRDNFERTKVTCSACGVECEVPFKPTSNKPVYCDACFSKNGKGRSNSGGISEADLDQLNAKLNKIMKALKIE